MGYNRRKFGNRTSLKPTLHVVHQITTPAMQPMNSQTTTTGTTPYDRLKLRDRLLDKLLQKTSSEKPKHSPKRFEPVLFWKDLITPEQEVDKEIDQISRTGTWHRRAPSTTPQFGIECGLATHSTAWYCIEQDMTRITQNDGEIRYCDSAPGNLHCRSSSSCKVMRDELWRTSTTTTTTTTTERPVTNKQGRMQPQLDLSGIGRRTSKSTARLTENTIAGDCLDCGIKDTKDLRCKSFKCDELANYIDVQNNDPKHQPQCRSWTPNCNLDEYKSFDLCINCSSNVTIDRCRTAECYKGMCRLCVFC